MTVKSASLDTNWPKEAPENNGTFASAESCEWALGRFTAPSWAVTSATLERNTHAPIDDVCLSATLKHDSDSLIQVQPVDPLEHARQGVKQYSAHRVRCRNSIDDSSYYVTHDKPAGYCRLASLLHTDTHPYQKEAKHIRHHPQSAIHEADREAQNEKQACIETIRETVQAVFGAAQEISEKHGQQSALGSW